jgi:hypothetical protein
MIDIRSAVFRAFLPIIHLHDDRREAPIEYGAATTVQRAGLRQSGGKPKLDQKRCLQ